MSFDGLDVKFELEDSVLAALLERVDGQDLRVVVGFDKFRAADTQFALARLDSVVLHTSRGISGRCINEIALNRNR